MGVPLLATSWWSLLLGLYGYVPPFVLYATWVAIAMWDLIRRDADSIPHRARWMAVVLLVPFVGPLLYFAFGRSPVPSQLRLMLTVGGIGAYSSSSCSGSCSRLGSSWIRIRLKALPLFSVFTTVT